VFVIFGNKLGRSPLFLGATYLIETLSFTRMHYSLGAADLTFHQIYLE